MKNVVRLAAMALLAHFTFQSHAVISDYVPSWCTINRVLLQGAKALNDQMIYMAAMQGSPEAVKLLQEYYAQKSPMELMCEIGATNLSEFGSKAIQNIIRTSPAISSATEALLYSILYKALDAVTSQKK